MAAKGQNTVTTKQQPRSNLSKLDTIHHVAIPVPDVAKAVEWYTSRFNCNVDYIDESWALLAFANTKLALVLPQEHPAHFALIRPDANKFGDLVKHRDGLNSVYITDAFGNSIEVLEES
ncbi:MAG: VOC family protein [Nitrospirales bacterium]|nr:VOC family protein [Nitrospira sp.]MDR4462308.1 VOC family protein [Nitrospirales bacterium]MDR4484596.1 VOC family protein [Nitrospirales bacterium]